MNRLHTEHWVSAIEPFYLVCCTLSITVGNYLLSLTVPSQIPSRATLVVVSCCQLLLCRSQRRAKIPQEHVVCALASGEYMLIADCLTPFAFCDLVTTFLFVLCKLFSEPPSGALFSQILFSTPIYSHSRQSTHADIQVVKN